MRLDKWLWAARFFKTRALASRACELGRISSNGQTAKASRELRAGDLLQVKTETAELQVKVLVLGEVRGPATLAQTYYEETEESRLLRQKLAEQQKAMAQFGDPAAGKLTKRDRREMERFRGRG